MSGCRLLNGTMRQFQRIQVRLLRTLPSGRPGLRSSRPRYGAPTAAGASVRARARAQARAGESTGARIPRERSTVAPDEDVRSTAVTIAEDQDSILSRHGTSGAVTLVSQPALVVCRQIEMLNIFAGFEEANRYVIYGGDGSVIGYIAEEGGGLGKGIARQMAGTHRAFSCAVLDPAGNVILRIRRPFSWVNSRIQVLTVDAATGDETLVGETLQRWHPLRRKYELYLNRTTSMVQFGAVDEPPLSWDFSVLGEGGKLLGSVNRNMRGLMRELFSDTGHYVLRMDAASPRTTNLSTSGIVASPAAASGEAAEARDAIAATAHRQVLNQANNTTQGQTALATVPTRSMSLDERAVLLATAVTIDFDYFSKLSRAGPGMGGGFGMPLPIFMPIPGFGGGGGGGQQTPQDSIGTESTPGALTPEQVQQDVADTAGASGQDMPWWQQEAEASDSDYAPSDTGMQGGYNDSNGGGFSQPQGQEGGNWWDNAGGPGMQDDGDPWADTDRDLWGGDDGGGGDWGGGGGDGGW